MASWHHSKVLKLIVFILRAILAHFRDPRVGQNEAAAVLWCTDKRSLSAAGRHAAVFFGPPSVNCTWADAQEVFYNQRFVEPPSSSSACIPKDALHHVPCLPQKHARPQARQKNLWHLSEEVQGDRRGAWSRFKAMRWNDVLSTICKLKRKDTKCTHLKVSSSPWSPSKASTFRPMMLQQQLPEQAYSPQRCENPPGRALSSPKRSSWVRSPGNRFLGSETPARVKETAHSCQITSAPDQVIEAISNFKQVWHCQTISTSTMCDMVWPYRSPKKDKARSRLGVALRYHVADSKWRVSWRARLACLVFNFQQIRLTTWQERQ